MKQATACNRSPSTGADRPLWARTCRGLGLSAKSGVDLDHWFRELDDDYQRLAAGLVDNPYARIE
ncbi:hypothetical protein [Streptomyces carpinensis]|uniref:Uncharacterized protein n=1 Tax=Streptomyces carpinensis TaxID=66369 RepID=A0ABV1VWT2_9ACTN|nr:hypothetical protein [Streptomyces carpinensis]